MTIVEITGIGRLALAAGFIPLAATFYSLALAGQTLTEPQDRTRLGNWLAVFCGAVGTVFVCMTVLIFNRWIDLDPTTANHAIGLVFTAVGVVALVVALIAAHYSGPAVLMRILRGPEQAT